MPILLGFRVDGRPIWSFSGGAPEDGDGGDSGGDDGNDDADNDGDGEKPDVLKETLQKERVARREATRELKSWTNTLKSLGIGSPEDLAKRLGDTSGKPVDPEAIRRDAEQAAEAKANVRVAKSRVEALATRTFASTRDALMNFRDDEWDDFLTRSGEPDDNAIKDRLKEILRDNPHYAVKADGGTDFEGGARQTAGGKDDFNSFLRGQSARKRGGR
jgi:hypothetical protein